MPSTIPVDRYTCHFFSSRDEDDLLIYLYDEKSNVVAELRFVAPPHALPPAGMVNGRRRLYYRRSTFAEVLDILRNESPIFLHPREDGSVSISSAFEPVGDGERVFRVKSRA
jgi:hypothetical protein